ncbi:DUF1127 domain-containing protein [Phaeovulum sp.]|uniref:DUF1127 domain-containing protein n=1 Tax=Phaeovulum sp. TaxID=2934796 RepID=UPI00272EF63A|nr:DUF1127 domain-containing protein [Phaeovulum sp.]MDP1668452.1 DUF1127 domain-containing protein [Phaeovulum sp.]MDP2063369.1 DUF1127 domain-containing protein [Phaeovulum sp.]MDP3862691.1 DUF1127 domain-containing protein [Phaeovulum sp.]MDZ4118895.1 DUF1127 domain-containing protein [Phaeovulum sp.]
MAFALGNINVDLGLADRAAALFARLGEARQRRKVFRQTLRELGALSSRELTDLGIPRSMITRVAIEAAYGKGGK